MATLIVKNLIKTYKKNYIVNNVNLKINSGEIVGLLGPNGAGKSTVFDILVGLVLCEFGKIILNDENISTLPIYERAKKGIIYLPQETSIFRRLSVYDNIMSILEIRNTFSKKEKKIYIKVLMQEFNIWNLRDQLGLSLSGGERRRVEIARSLAANPKFILLDEPFSGIDPIAINDIKKIVKNLKKRGLGILITDHNVRETLKICNKAYILYNGKIIQHGTPKDILKDHYVKNIYLGKDFKL